MSGIDESEIAVAPARDPGEVFIVQRSFLEFDANAKVTPKDINGRADIDFLIQRGALVPMLAGGIAMKGSTLTWGELLNEIENLSSELETHRYRSSRQVQELEKQLKLVEERAGGTTSELLKKLAELTKENAALKAQMKDAGLLKDELEPAAEPIPEAKAAVPESATPPGSLKPGPMPARTQGNKLKGG